MRKLKQTTARLFVAAVVLYGAWMIWEMMTR